MREIIAASIERVQQPQVLINSESTPPETALGDDLVNADDLVQPSQPIIAGSTDKDLIYKYSRAEIVQKLDDYFSSAALTVSPQGAFTLLNSRMIFKTEKIPSEYLQRTPLFAVTEKVSPEFALAYATFLSKATENLIPAINALIKTVNATDWKQDHYSFYYLCLRTLAVTQVVDQRISRCLNESIANFQIEKPDAFIQMANIYMKL